MRTSDYTKLHIQDKIALRNKECSLLEELVPYVEGDVKIADIGSGPFTFIGTTLEGHDIKVYPSDSQDFTHFWDIRGLKPYIPVERQNMEKLTYPDNEFDIVFCHNALDHTRNAKEAVKELIRISKKWVIIICSPNQLDTGYLHHWNAKHDGIFDNYKEKFDLKDFGFQIRFKDNLITATLKK